MNLENQGPLAAALGAAIVWLVVELRRAQDSAANSAATLAKVHEGFGTKIAALYEARLADFREWLAKREEAH